MSILSFWKQHLIEEIFETCDNDKDLATSLVIFHSHCWIAWVYNIKFLSPTRITATGCARSDGHTTSRLMICRSKETCCTVEPFCPILKRPSADLWSSLSPFVWIRTTLLATATEGRTSLHSLRELELD